MRKIAFAPVSTVFSLLLFLLHQLFILFEEENEIDTSMAMTTKPTTSLFSFLFKGPTAWALHAHAKNESESITRNAFNMLKL